MIYCFIAVLGTMMCDMLKKFATTFKLLSHKTHVYSIERNACVQIIEYLFTFVQKQLSKLFSELIDTKNKVFSKSHVYIQNNSI